MAVKEAGIESQYRLLQEEAGLLARPDRGQVLLEGPEAAEYLQGQITNDVEALDPGQGCYAALLDAKGHMQADLRVLRVDGEEIWLDTEPAGSGALWKHLNTYKIGRRVSLEDVSAQRTVLSLIGPRSREVAAAPSLAAEHDHAAIDLAEAPCRVVATDLGVDVIVRSQDLERVHAHLLSAGAAEVDEAAAEIRRIETGRPRYGAEMTSATIPQEAALNERAVSFTKGCYIGQETVARLFYKGKPNRHLRGLRLSQPVEAGAPLLLGDREVGEIGSACVSPRLGSIGLAIVRREAEPGEMLSTGYGASAEVIELPFGI